MILSRSMAGFSLPLAIASLAFGQQYLISTYAGGAPPPTPAAATAVSIGGTGGSGGLVGVATNSAGNVYFAGDQCVFRLDTSGVLTRVAGISRIGYSGDGGPATSAQLYNPEGVAVDSAGNLYIADSSNNRIRKVTPPGIISTVAGNGGYGYSGDGGPASSATFSNPSSVAVDSAGDLYIADEGDSAIRKVTPAGIISTVAGNGTQGNSGDGGPATSAQLYNPLGVAPDSAGNLYIAEYSTNRVRKVTPAGIISTVAGNGAPDYSGDGGPAMSATLFLPTGVGLDSAGNLYIADTGNQRIRKVTPAGIISTVAGSVTAGYSDDGGPATSAALFFPAGLALDSTGNLYISDTGNQRIRKLTPAGIISTVAGNGILSYSGDGGSATSSQLFDPEGEALDSGGNLYIADVDNNRIRKVTPAGIISTTAGTGTPGYSGDGGPATSAQLVRPLGVALDSAGNLYIADEDTNRIRKVTPAGIISTTAGTGNYGYSGDGGPATSAELYAPCGIALDSAGDLYIADTNNNSIRKVTPAGIISTVAGNGTAGYAGDGGPATSATLNMPQDIAVDSAGNLYIGDFYNRRIRKVTPAGTISTVAGNGTPGYSGDGGPATSAQLGYPSGVALDSAGNLYIADRGNADIRKVTPAGIISTVAGSQTGGYSGYSGDGGPATSAHLNEPNGVALDSAGRIYVADSANNAIRLLTPQGVMTSTPVITPGGIVPADSSINTIQPGEWISIYGTNLANTANSWNGTFTTALGGVSVTINGKSAWLSYVGPLQINAQAPDDTATGTVSVVVTTANSTASGTVSLAKLAPSLLLLDDKHVAGIILRSNGSGAYGGGSYDIIGPTGSSLGYQTVAAKAGDSVALYAVGLGPTDTAVTSGTAFVGATPVTTPVSVMVNGISVTPSFSGLSGAGLYQLNLTLPAGLGPGDVPLAALVGGVQTQAGVVISLQ